MTLPIRSKLIKIAASLNLTVACLIVLMILVFAATLSQINLGIYFAKKTFFQTLWVYWEPQPHMKIPVFPGGLLVGWVLFVNLIVAHVTRFKWTFQKTGIWLTHVGLILLIAGSGLSSYLAKESQMAIQIGETKNYTTSAQEFELAIISEASPTTQQVISIPQSSINSHVKITPPSLPFTLVIKDFFSNSKLSMNKEGSSIATQGIGPQIAVDELPLDKHEGGVNTRTAYVEIFEGTHSKGIWLLSTGLGAPQTVVIGSKIYTLWLRPKRVYLPYTVTLLKFSHDVYPGTTIPKNFSSHVRVVNPVQKETRDFLIYMNNPLRYQGQTFYQASFGGNDTLSVLQVVQNPSWLVPYISCSMIFLGLLIHFMTMVVQRTQRKPHAHP